MKEMQPIGQAQGKPYELTGPGLSSYSISRRIIMPEGEVSMPEPKIEPGKLDLPNAPVSDVEHSGFFADSDIRDPHTRSTLSLISEASEVPEDKRRAALDKLAEDIGLDREAAQKRINELREGLPAGGTSDTRAQLGGSAGGAPVSPDASGSGADTILAEIRDILRESSTRRNRSDIERGRVTEILNMSPRERQRYFDEIFMNLDARPNDLSQEIYGQLTQPYQRFQEFIVALAEGASSPEFATREGEILRDMDGNEKIDENGNPIRFSREGLAAELRRYQAEEGMNVALHDLSAVLYRPDIKFEQINGFIARMDSKTADYAFGYKGVEDMMNFYEFSIRESMALNNGYLDPRKMRGEITTEINEGVQEIVVEKAEIEERAKALFKIAVQEGRVKQRTRDGKEVTLGTRKIDEDGREYYEIEDWEVERIFSIARGMMIASQATLALAAESELPKGHAKSGSGFLQDIIQSYSPLRHLNGKWEIASEALAAFLVKGKSGDSEFDKFFSRFDPNELKEAWARFQDDPETMLNSLTNVYYLGRQNPNYGGDIWTFVSWRADLDPETISAIQRLLIIGRKKQARRWDERRAEGVPSSQEYITFLESLDSSEIKMSEDEFHSSTQEERDILKRRNKLARKVKIENWENTHPNAPKINEFKAYYDEYQDWTGTAFLLEKQRGKLKKLKSKKSEERSDGETAAKESMHLVSRMVELQPHRLFSKSKYIRKRVLEAHDFSEHLDSSQQAEISQRLRDLQMVESALLNDRENLLDGEEPIFFDKLSLGEYFERAIIGDIEIKDESGTVIRTISEDERRRNAREFAEWIRQDFETHQGSLDDNYRKIKFDDINRDGLYYKEFVENREYTHGFVLWRGDIPVAEYDSSAVGPTGPIIRRGRDSENQEKAGQAVTVLMDNLKNVKQPEDLIKLIDEVFAPIDHYNRPLAKQVVADILPLITMVFREDSRFVNVPFLRHLSLKGRKSFARIVYGNHAPAWSVAQTNKIIEEVGHHYAIDHELIEEMQEDAGARNFKAIMEFATNLEEFMIILAILGVAVVINEGFKDIES
jgi:hypothetical protein